MQNISYHGNELHHTLLLISLQMINTSKLSLLNYVLYVPLAPRALVPYVLSCLTWLVLFVRSWPTWLVSYAISCSTCLMLYILSCLTCLVLCVLPCITCLVPYVASCLALCEPFFLTYPIVSYLAYSFPNINSCTLEFPCTTLVFFYSFATCSFFGGKFIQVKTNILCRYYFELTISLYQQYDIFKLFETKCKNIYIWNCKLFWYKWRWI